MFWHDKPDPRTPDEDFWRAALWINDSFYLHMKSAYKHEDPAHRHLHVFNAFHVLDRYIYMAASAGAFEIDDDHLMDDHKVTLKWKPRGK